MQNNSIKCVIFDCDGTLVDSEKLCCQALVESFAECGANVTLAQCYEEFKGGKLADILLDMSAKFEVSASVDTLEPLYRHKVKSLFETHLKAMPGAIEIIDFLKNEDIEFCIASNAPKDKIEFTLSLTNLIDDFDGKIFSAFEANSWKPEPDLILYSAMRMGFLPNECVYIDDTPKGVEAGLNAGVRTYQLYNGTPANRINDSRVRIINRLSQLQQDLMATLTN